MNVTLPFAEKWWAWLALFLLMVCLIISIWIIFKRKKML